MRPSRVLDTNVLLDRPFEEVINSFDECDIVIPFAVIQELDKFKDSNKDILRENSRIASNYIDKLREQGSIHEGIELDSGHKVIIELNHSNTLLDIDLPYDDMDTRILKVAKGIQEDNKNVILCTQDTNQRIVADLLGVPSEDYGEDIDLDELYDGYKQIFIDGDSINDIHLNRRRVVPGAKMYENEFVLMHDSSNPKHTYISRHKNGCLDKARYCNSNAFGITPLNLEQRFFMDLLMDPDIDLVTAIGGAGTGKSLLSIASGIEQVSNTHVYNKISISRPFIELGGPIGFLPGDEIEKTAPWLKSTKDNLEFIASGHASEKNGDSKDPECAAKNLMDFANIEVQALTFIRGRSMPNQFVIIEEAQNLNKHEIKTIISRIGHNAKIVVIGDIEQIDNPRLSKTNNGLVHLINAFKDDYSHGHVTLKKTERSELADKAINLL